MHARGDLEREIDFRRVSSGGGVISMFARRLGGLRCCASAAARVLDRFALLQTERRFDLNLQDLQRTYKALMADAHPDRHGHRSAEEQRQLADHASDITDAYAVLRAPHLRAVHLLELHGAPLNEDTGSDVLGPDFLMQIMEVREELEEVGAEPPRLAALRETNQQAMDELHAQLHGAFDVKPDVETARALTARLQYLQRIEEEIHERMPVK